MPNRGTRAARQVAELVADFRRTIMPLPVRRLLIRAAAASSDAMTKPANDQRQAAIIAAAFLILAAEQIDAEGL